MLKKIDNSIIALMAITALAIVGLFVWRVTYSNALMADIRSPVVLTGDSYKIGEDVRGFFIGEIFTDQSPTITRKVQCEEQRFDLIDVPVNGSDPLLIRGKEAKIFSIDPSEIANNNSVHEDKNCVIAFRNVYCADFLGFTACNNTTRYYSAPFDITN